MKKIILQQAYEKLNDAIAYYSEQLGVKVIEPKRLLEEIQWAH